MKHPYTIVHNKDLNPEGLSEANIIWMFTFGEPCGVHENQL